MSIADSDQNQNQLSVSKKKSKKIKDKQRFKKQKLILNFPKLISRRKREDSFNLRLNLSLSLSCYLLSWVHDQQDEALHAEGSTLQSANAIFSKQ